jgi:hypothetical protein
MFIENANPTIPPRSSGEKRTCVPLQETLRSAGARGGCSKPGFYKHSAPLEPEHFFGNGVSIVKSVFICG